MEAGRWDECSRPAGKQAGTHQAGLQACLCPPHSPCATSACPARRVQQAGQRAQRALCRQPGQGSAHSSHCFTLLHTFAHSPESSPGT